MGFRLVDHETNQTLKNDPSLVSVEIKNVMVEYFKNGTSNTYTFAIPLEECSKRYEH
jgi:hypothetical protein